ncbi:GtrA family protein [Paraburkholderia sp. DHOC27]|uniref:GtrA family protein n=1 Tax=Paraburkholderia sp. DHOC27 TaxID=2303330 RepID=UPI0015F35081|nr:GtrA family protein [Paraburkholderia sp. DHOC27]
MQAKTIKSFFQFATVSGCGWLLDSSLLFLFTQWLNLPVFQANFLSSVIAAVVVFSVSRLLVFRARSGRYLVRTGLYTLYTCMVILLASLAMPWALLLAKALAHHFALPLGAGAEVLLAKVFITPPQLLANFFTARVLATAMTALHLREGSAAGDVT